MTYRPYAFIISQAQGSTVVKCNNNTGSTIPTFTPVSINASGELSTVDVTTDPSSVATIGITSESIPDGSNGSVVVSGIISNVTTSFAQGEFLYISKTGGLQNTAPTIGVSGFAAGDSVIRAGIILKNVDTPTQKDFLVKIELVGRL